MTIFSRLLLTAIMCLAAFQAMASAPSETEAMAWCDGNLLSPVEGIWEYPEDGARVLIQADSALPGSFTLTVLSTPDCRLQPGDVIGRLFSSVDPRQFRLNQSTRKDKTAFTKSCDCLAVLSADGETLKVKSPKVKFKINLHTLLPRFWRVVRLSVDNPVDELPAGLVKVYPGYDHNGSLRRQIRVL